MNLSEKRIGLALMAFSILLFVILVGIKLDADKQANYLCDNFHAIQSEVGACPAHTSNIGWLLLVAFAVDVAIFLSGFYFAFVLKQQVNGESVVRAKKNFDTGELNEEENAVYTIVLDKGGSVFQGDLIRESGFSKVKVSRILDRLEAAGGIERKRRGMANLIVQK